MDIGGISNRDKGDTNTNKGGSLTGTILRSNMIEWTALVDKTYTFCKERRGFQKEGQRWK